MNPKLISLVFALGTFFAQRSLAHAHPAFAPMSLTVSVFNDAAVPPEVLLVAQDRAVFILQRAGISLVWLDCGTPGNRPPNSACGAISYPQHLSIRLISHASLASEDTFAQSFQDADGAGNYAVVYFRTLESSKAARMVTAGELLGHVVAHELGHLLLGLNSHSAAGLMLALWQAPELYQAAHGNLFFTGEQADRMRSRYLTARAQHRKTSEALPMSSGN
jgi:hypothetical protein